MCAAELQIQLNFLEQCQQLRLVRGICFLPFRLGSIDDLRGKFVPVRQYFVRGEVFFAGFFGQSPDEIRPIDAENFIVRRLFRAGHHVGHPFGGGHLPFLYFPFVILLFNRHMVFPAQ